MLKSHRRVRRAGAPENTLQCLCLNLHVSTSCTASRVSIEERGRVSEARRHRAEQGRRDGVAAGEGLERVEREVRTSVVVLWHLHECCPCIRVDAAGVLRRATPPLSPFGGSSTSEGTNCSLSPPQPSLNQLTVQSSTNLPWMSATTMTASSPPPPSAGGLLPPFSLSASSSHPPPPPTSNTTAAQPSRSPTPTSPLNQHLSSPPLPSTTTTTAMDQDDELDQDAPTATTTQPPLTSTRSRSSSPPTPTALPTLAEKEEMRRRKEIERQERVDKVLRRAEIAKVSSLSRARVEWVWFLGDTRWAMNWVG